VCSLVPRPLPDFISQLSPQLEINLGVAWEQGYSLCLYHAMQVCYMLQRNGKALWLEKGMEVHVWKEESEGTMEGGVKEWGEERERKERGRGRKALGVCLTCC